jgi:hypothetical protein
MHGYFSNVIGSCAAIIQAALTFAIWLIYRRQTEIMNRALNETHRGSSAAQSSADAALASLKAFEKLQRPFLMVEVRNHTEVWIINKGRVAAQIVWIDTAPTWITKEWEKLEEMPADYNYGPHYDDQGTEVFNQPWLAPEGERNVATFDPTTATSEEIGLRNKVQLTMGSRVLYFLSAIKYRGILNDKVFESRWCFSWSHAKGLYHAGPWPSYNSYT